MPTYKIIEDDSIKLCHDHSLTLDAARDKAEDCLTECSDLDAVLIVNEDTDEPVFRVTKTVVIQHTEIGEDRCEHGMFYSGAGACPQCGGGAE